MSKYDVIVVGAGPAGYVAAIRCAQLGLRTACVEKWRNAGGNPALGGTCLNVGCIPSKALLDSSHHYHNLTHLLPSHGISLKEPAMDIAAMQKRKDKIVTTLTRGVAGLFKKNKIEWLQGRAKLCSQTTVEVAPADGGEPHRHEAEHIILASGSVPIEIGAAPLDGESIVDSSGALAFDAVPERLGIIGAGVIGLELGSVWNRLGAKVTVLEALPDFLPAVDNQIAAQAKRLLSKQGLDIKLGAKVTAAKTGDSEVTVTYEDKTGEQSIKVDKLVVAVGRRAYTDGLNLAEVKINTDKQGRIEVDEHCFTGVGNIYAVGDAVRGPMLAHKGSEEGVMVAERIAGQAGHVNLEAVPWVIYIHPEIAWVGKTEQELKEEGTEYRVGSFPFMAAGRAKAAGETDGLVKVLADAKNDKILGVHIFGAQASELVAEAVTAMEFHASSEDLARTIHAHPTLAEAIHEAALATDGRAIHM